MKSFSEFLTERQKDSDNQRLSQERGRSNYGKASVRNVRATGQGGNGADPAERLVAMDARHKAHKEKRGVKTKGLKEGLTGARAQRAREMQDSDIKKGGGKRTNADRDTAFRLGTGTSETRVSQKQRKGASDQGKGNAAKRRMSEGVGLSIARAIDKTNPPLGRASKRKAISHALKMREIMKDTKKNKQKDDPYSAGKIAKAALGGKDSKKKKKPEKSPVSFLQDKQVKESAWQRKEGKNPSGGLNEKGRKSYERENPGSDLKAPQPEGGPRKRSFCARMSGVKGPMKDEKGRPTRKALALRKWKC